MQALTGVFCVLIGAIVGGLIMGLLIASSDFKMTELNSERIYESHKSGFKSGYESGIIMFADEIANRVTDVTKDFEVCRKVIYETKAEMVGGVENDD